MRGASLALLPALTAAAAALALPGAARGDEIVFTNGDRLTGKVVRAEDGTLVVQTQVAGEVKVPLEKVRTLSTEAPVTVRLRDGTVLRRPLAAAEGEGVFTLAGEGAVGPQAFRLAEVEAINPPEPRVRWRGSLVAALAITRGESQTEQASAALDMVRRTKEDRFTVAGAYLYGRQENPETGERETTADAWSTAAKYDYFVEEQSYLYASTRMERDRIAGLDLRLAPGAGAGRQWVEREDLGFSTEAGLSWVYEDYEVMPEDQEKEHLAARVAYRLERRWSDHVSLVHELEWFPSLEEGDDHFLTAKAGLRLALTETIFAEFKVAVNHDSTPAEGGEETNTLYVLGAGVKF